MSWLDLVPTCTSAYVYQAALVCEDCAAEIKEELDQKGVRDDEDSDTYPQGPHEDGGGEADSAEFCDQHRNCVNAVEIAKIKIGCPLKNPLTSEGAAALRDTIRQNILSTKKYSRMLGRLLRRVWANYVQEAEYVGAAVVPQKFPATLEKLLKRYARTNEAVIDHCLVLDADHAYFVARRDQVIDLLRATADDEGELDQLDVATVLASIVEGRDPRDAVVEAISEGAWD